MFDVPPQIQSAGLPPERHAQRIIAEMTRWLIGERERCHVAMIAAMGKSPGNPVAQGRWVARMRKAAGRGIIDLQIVPGKRGKFCVAWADWGVVTYDGTLLTEKDVVPGKPLLACRQALIAGAGRRGREIRTFELFVVSHHAMVRLAMRCGARTVDDLLAALKELWGVYCDRPHNHTLADDMRLPVAGGLAVVEKTETARIVKTILSPE
jgi:hypothetical protein